MMKKGIFKNRIKNMVLGLGVLVFLGCGSMGTVVKMPQVKDVPEGKYESIIKLENPAAPPDKKFAGLVFIKKGASVCTDYPRQEIMKSLDDLTVMERHSYKFFTHYAIASGGKTYGFVSVPLEYNVMLWNNEKDESCRLKVQLIWLEERNSSLGDEMHKAGPGGHGR